MSRQRKIIGDSLVLGTRQVIGLVLVTLQTLFAARYLGPAGFGTFAIISVLSMMASVGNLGYLAAASRELPHYRATGDAAREKTTLNHTAIGELGIAVLWTLVILAVAAFQDNRDLQVFLALVALSVVPAKLLAIYQLMAYVDKDFELQSRASLIVSAVTAGLVIALVWKFNLYIVLLAPVVASSIGVLAYRHKYRIDLVPADLRRDEFLRLAKIGLPMTGLAVVSSNNGLQRWAERTLIASYAGTAALGIYAFFSWITMAMYSMFGGVLQALQPHVYELLSKELDDTEVGRYLIKPIWTIIALALLAIGGASVILPDIIALLLPEYLPGIPVLNVLLFATLIGCMYWIPGIMMSATRFDAQFFYFVAWCIAIAISVCVAVLMLRMDNGIMSLAVAYLVSQIILLALTFARLWRFLFPTARAFLSLLKELVVPVINVAIAVIVISMIGTRVIPATTAASDLLLIVAGKAIVFILLSIPTALILETKTGIYATHIRPMLSKAVSNRPGR